MISVLFKQCNKCNKTFPISGFLSKSRRKINGDRVPYTDCRCKICRYAQHREIYKTPRGRYSCYKRSAKKRGISFNLTFEEFVTFWMKDCHYCGMKIKGIGIDRVDSGGKYEIDNIVPCCTPCNMFKSKLGKTGFIEMCIKVAEYQKK